jgi:hypothetical protein
MQAAVDFPPCVCGEIDQEGFPVHISPIAPPPPPTIFFCTHTAAQIVQKMICRGSSKAADHTLDCKQAVRGLQGWLLPRPRY